MPFSPHLSAKIQNMTEKEQALWHVIKLTNYVIKKTKSIFQYSVAK